jgi:toxin ParE1/3/4
MGDYKLSNSAKKDLANIYEFGIETFGYNQAQHYLMQLHKHLLSIAENPSIGRDAWEFSEGLKRFVFESHTIFYQPMNTGVFIVCVLGQRMGHQKYL